MVGSPMFIVKSCRWVCLFSMAAVRAQVLDSDISLFEGEPIEVNIFDNEDWRMDLSISLWQSNSDPSVDP